MSYQLPLSQLLQSLAVVDAQHDRLLTGISMDSREVQSGSVFLSLAKTPTQRLKYLQQALKSGAEVVLMDSATAPDADEIKAVSAANAVLLRVPDLGEQASLLAARFYQQPSQAMTIIAVTGTNGKTSVSQFIAAIYQQLGVSCGVMGTLGVGTAEQLHDTGMTTPDPVRVQAMLATMRDAGVEAVALEASSHALSQGRLNAVAVDIAVFTNLSHDHLDYHGTMQAYGEAKARLLRFPTLKAAVINVDDDFGRQLSASLENTVKPASYSLTERSAAFYAQDIDYQSDGMRFTFAMHDKCEKVQTALFGRFNISNLLAAAGAVICAGGDSSRVIEALSACQPVTGRMQQVRPGSQPAVIVDYAHTPDALKQALTVCREHKTAVAELWCVFGCGGDRDQGKRPLMGQIASALAERVVLTDDNPRHEQSEKIIEDIAMGCSDGAEVVIRPSRREAIEFSILQAASQDLVLIAGKGHENYQQIGDQKMPFSDIEEASLALQKRDNREVAL